MSDTIDAPVSSPSSSEPAPSSAPSEPTSTPAPSTAPAPSEQAPSPPSPGTHTRETERQGLLAAVQDVVKLDPDPIVGEPRPQDATETPATGPPSPSSTTAPGSAPEPPPADPSEAELSTYKPDTRRRIEQLLAQRNEARQTSERFKADADAFNQFRAYQQQHQLENDDINLLLATGAALRRGDFRAFLDGVMPYVEVAQQAMGVTLPADLHQQVENGQIPLETAREISMARVNQARLETEANTYREGMQMQGQQQLASTIYNAVSGWEQNIKARDPDWALKQDVVERYSQALVASEGRPTSPAQAVAMAQRAYEEANRVVARMRPAPVATRTQPSGVQSIPGNGADPEPRNLMEAAILGLQRGNRARLH